MPRKSLRTQNPEVNRVLAEKRRYNVQVQIWLDEDQYKQFIEIKSRLKIKSRQVLLRGMQLYSAQFKGATGEW
jgi:hypothetical protein